MHSQMILSYQNEMEQRTELSTLGEFGLIDRLTKDNQIKNKTTIVGVGDDCAILDYKRKQILVSTDTMAEGVHFDMVYTPLKHLGYKAAVSNFSDIYAMNGQPKQITIALSVSNRYSVEALDELYAGIRLACEQYGVDIVGGDTTSCLAGMVITITVLGEGEKDKIVRRNTAKENDLVCVTGDLGGAYAGLLVLQREKTEWKINPNVQPNLESYDYVLERQLKPEAQRWLVEFLNKNNIVPTSMIDISDGLASEVLHICHDSKVGCEIYMDRIPIDYQTSRTLEEFKIAAETGALNGGEDYELLFTIDQKDYDLIKDQKDIHIIGYIREQSAGCKLITKQNTSIDIKAQGWDHYKQS